MRNLKYLLLSPFIVGYIFITLPFVILAVFAAISAAMCEDDKAVSRLDKFIRKIWWFDSNVKGRK